MLKRLMIIILCLSIGIFFTSISFSQDDPSTTEENKVENPKDEAKDKVKDSTDKGSSSAMLQAKAYFDGKNTYVNSKVLFKLYSKDNVETDKIEYNVDGGETKIYSNPFSIDQEGRHIINYYGIDKTNNKEKIKRYSVIVDNTGPAIIVTNSKGIQKINNKIYISKDINFSIAAEDTLSGVNKIEYSINGKDFQEYITPFTILSEGEVDLKVKAIDNVNNISEQYSFKIIDESGKEIDLKESSLKLATDNIPPVVVIKPDKELKQSSYKNVASTDVKYVVTATDNESGISSVYVRIDQKGDFVAYNGEIQFMTNGEHVIEAKAMDKVGNVSNVASFTVYVDTIAPESGIETNPEPKNKN